jgi:hypothetical protein
MTLVEAIQNVEVTLLLVKIFNIRKNELTHKIVKVPSGIALIIVETVDNPD